MENKEEFMDKIPFYMTYPMQNLYLAEMEYEKDMERMKELYPTAVREIVRLVEARCDQLEQEGSRLYDENPDRMMMEKEAEALYRQYVNREEAKTEPKEEPKKTYSIVPPEEFRETMPSLWEEEKLPEMTLQMNRYDRGCKDSWLCHLFQIIFDDEVYRRRCRHRRCRRWG